MGSFYVAAPTPRSISSVPTAVICPIEERSPREVTHIGGRRIAAEGVDVFNPAFDVTPPSSSPASSPSTASSRQLPTGLKRW
jgi:methylthioribose-1-phosphate isomerase